MLQTVISYLDWKAFGVGIIWMTTCGMASIFAEFIINPKGSANQVSSIKFFKNIITVWFIMNLILLNLLSNIWKWCRNSLSYRRKPCHGIFLYNVSIFKIAYFWDIWGDKSSSDKNILAVINWRKSNRINQSIGNSLFQNETRSLHRKSCRTGCPIGWLSHINKERTDVVVRCLGKAAWAHEYMVTLSYTILYHAH